ncbi:hypothetical protein DK427_15010 [Methylobacterium radiodurans]|uniref:Uncharacterized protein n=1 Tax=Methylobacterium radiodurans TaxID=2202828 RepID=A0A2U8VTX1_9HYPH|nr:hypothetical protein DK427_15010 [Methylobacterium radiodurans]
MKAKAPFCPVAPLTRPLLTQGPPSPAEGGGRITRAAVDGPALITPPARRRSAASAPAPRRR